MLANCTSFTAIPQPACALAVYNFIKDTNGQAGSSNERGQNCLKDAFNTAGRPTSADSRLSQLYFQPSCRSQIAVGVFGPAMEACFSACEYQAYLCLADPACAPYLAVAVPSTYQERNLGPVTYNFTGTSMLTPATNAVQYACANATAGSASAVQPVNTTLVDASCARDLGACVGDADCRRCFEIFKEVNAGSIDSVSVFTNCSDGDGAALALYMRSHDSCYSLATISPSGVCLRKAWECISFGPVTSRECLSDLAVYAVSIGDVEDDDVPLYGTMLPEVNVHSETWFDLLTSPQCTGMIQTDVTVGGSITSSYVSMITTDDDFTPQHLNPEACATSFFFFLLFFCSRSVSLLKSSTARTRRSSATTTRRADRASRPSPPRTTLWSTTRHTASYRCTH